MMMKKYYYNFTRRVSSLEYHSFNIKYTPTLLISKVLIKVLEKTEFSCTLEFFLTKVQLNERTEIVSKHEWVDNYSEKF